MNQHRADGLLRTPLSLMDSGQAVRLASMRHQAARPWTPAAASARAPDGDGCMFGSVANCSPVMPMRCVHEHPLAVGDREDDVPVVGGNITLLVSVAVLVAET